MIEIGERLGLILLYLFVAGCAVLALSLFAHALVTLLSGKRQRQGLPEKDPYEAYRPSMLVGKPGWAKISLPQNVDSSAEPSPKPTRKGAGVAPISKQTTRPGRHWGCSRTSGRAAYFIPTGLVLTSDHARHCFSSFA
jgi:hypothetical protein